MKFADSWTCQEDGTSEVWIEHRKDLYHGYAKCHPNDEWSEFTGCRLAEMRAKLKAYKAEYFIAKQNYEECRKFVNAIKQYKKFNAEDGSAKAMFRQLNRRAIEVNELNKKIAALELEIRASIRFQNEINAKIKAKNGQK